MKAQESPLNALLEGQKQFIVPLFQRTYSLTEVNWATLWTDIIETAQPEVEGQHFLGSIIAKSLLGSPAGVAPYLVIDGQRLSCVCG